MPDPRPLKATASTLKQAGVAGGLLVQRIDRLISWAYSGPIAIVDGVDYLGEDGAAA